jgi:hypothetical protein
MEKFQKRINLTKIIRQMVISNNVLFQPTLIWNWEGYDNFLKIFVPSAEAMQGPSSYHI